MRIALKKEYHHSIYIFFLCFLAASIPVSNYFMSFTQLALCLNWFWEGDFKRKFADKQNNIVLGSFLLLFFVHVLWLANTQDFAFAFDDLRRKLPLLAIPILLFTSAPLSRKQYLMVLASYCIAVFVGSTIGIIRSFQFNDTNYREIIPFISHIRFSLNVCLVIFILFISFLLAKRKKKWQIAAGILLIVFLIYLLAVLQSFTGICILLVTGFILSVYLLFSKKISPVKKYMTFSIATLLLIAFTTTVFFYVKDYYTLRAISKENKTYTSQGNLYTHANDGFIENGNYVNNNICDIELQDAWSKRSAISVDSQDKAGNILYYTLVRYLNSKGLPKDAYGVESLTAKDVENIELGIGNYYYTKKDPIRKMTYKILFQLDIYLNSGNVERHSLLQRLELWKTGLDIIKENPLLGVGTGDVPQVIEAKLLENNSSLKGSKIRIHNQYITFLVAFGILGLTLILFALFFGVFKKKIIACDALFVAFYLIALLSMLSEDTLETEAGVTFFSFFFSFLFISSCHRTSITGCKKIVENSSGQYL